MKELKRYMGEIATNEGGDNWFKYKMMENCEPNSLDKTSPQIGIELGDLMIQR